MTAVLPWHVAANLQAVAGYMAALSERLKRLLWGPVISGYACDVRAGTLYPCAGCTCPVRNKLRPASLGL